MQKTYVLDANVLLQAPLRSGVLRGQQHRAASGGAGGAGRSEGGRRRGGKQRQAGPPLPGGPAAPGRFGKGRDPAQWRHRASGGQPCGRGPPPGDRARQPGGEGAEGVPGPPGRGDAGDTGEPGHGRPHPGPDDGGTGGGLHHRPAAGRRPALYRPGRSSTSPTICSRPSRKRGRRRRSSMPWTARGSGSRFL